MRIQRIKLNALSETQLHDKEMNAILGGVSPCECSCYYKDQGGSSTGYNAAANGKYGYISYDGCNETVFDPETGNLGASGKVTA